VVKRMLPDFRETIGLLSAQGIAPQLLMPTIAERRDELARLTADWPLKPHIVTGEADKFAAFRLARTALAASGTVTLELAAAGTPMVVAYRIGPVAFQFYRFTTAPSIVLANLVLGRNAFPEFLETAVSPRALAQSLAALLSDTPERAAQLQALAEIPGKLAPPASSPSLTAAAIVLTAARKGRLPLA